MEHDKQGLEDRINRLIEKAGHQVEVLGRVQSDILSYRHSPDLSLDESNHLESLSTAVCDTLNDLHVCVFRYLGMCNDHTLIALAKDRLGELRPKPERLDDVELDVEGDFYRSAYLDSVVFLLRSFDFRSSEIELREATGLAILENILESSGQLVTAWDQTPNSEAAVEKVVTPAISAAFPKSRTANANFNKIAKSFEPDVLVPEVRAVVEFKFASSETRLKGYFEQIAGDQKGYTDDPQYVHFFSVFYLTEPFWAKKKLLEAWKELNQISSWRPIYVTGRGKVLK